MQKNKAKIKNFLSLLQNVFILLLLIFTINIGLAYITGIQNIKSAYATDTSFLTNVNNPNVLIFLDSSGSMMWNKAVEYDNSAGVDPNPPESWAASGNAYYYNNHFERYYKSWSPGSNSMFSKIYNAKVAIEKIVSDSNWECSIFCVNLMC